MYRILLTDNLSPQGLAILQAVPDVEFETVKNPPPDKLASIIGNYEAIIIRSGVKLTAEILSHAKNLQVIGRAGVGVDNIDIPAASLRGIMVMNTPEANTIATVEHSFAMMLALCRNIPQSGASIHAGKWERNTFMGVQLFKKTLGIVGLGRIGSQMARRAKAFEMEILAFDPYISSELAQEMKVQLVDLPELLANSDFITLHAALTPQTRGMIGEEQIAQLKQGARIINCARGALIDEAALVKGLQEGKIAGAALDVFADEPIKPDSPLLGFANVVLTPHLAASTFEAQGDASSQIIQQVLDALHGVDFRHALNMPLGDAKTLSQLHPYLSLAEKIGSLQMQLAEGRIERVEVEVKGDEIVSKVKPITVALLKGLLSPILNESINYINAPLLARDRGISVTQISQLATLDYPNLISCRVHWPHGMRVISGSHFHGSDGRIVQFDSFRLDAQASGNILVITSRDVPGVLGRIGTILGGHGVNIASWSYARITPGGDALSFMGVDQLPSPEALQKLKAFEPIYNVKSVNL